jgi:hypothetical protein
MLMLLSWLVSESGTPGVNRVQELGRESFQYWPERQSVNLALTSSKLKDSRPFSSERRPIPPAESRLSKGGD